MNNTKSTILTEDAAFALAIKFGRSDKFDFRIPGTSESHKVTCAVMESDDVFKFAEEVAAIAVASMQCETISPQDSINGPLTDEQRQHAQSLYRTLHHLGPDAMADVVRYASVCGYVNGRKDFAPDEETLAQPNATKPWAVRERRNPSGELLDCFVEAPQEGDMPYALEVLGDDYTGYGDVERKLDHCKLIVSLVNAAAGQANDEKITAAPTKSEREWLERAHLFFLDGMKLIGLGDGSKGWIEHADGEETLRRDSFSLEGEILFGFEAIKDHIEAIKARTSTVGEVARLDLSSLIEYERNARGSDGEPPYSVEDFYLAADVKALVAALTPSNAPAPIATKKTPDAQ